MGDLSKLNSDREAFKAAVADTYPNKKPGAIPNNAGQLFRFVHEMEKGDLVVFPNKNDRKINVESYRVIETWMVTTALYVAACYFIAMLLRYLEQRLAIRR